MSELRDLYQEMILDHHRNPRNRRDLPDATHRAEGYNPLCGDKVTIRLRVEDDVIRDAAFDGEGCAISTASASMLTQAVKGLSTAKALALADAFQDLVTGKPVAVDMGKLEVFGGVRDYPSRVKCASLSWHTLRAALTGATEPATTE